MKVVKGTGNELRVKTSSSVHNLCFSVCSALQGGYCQFCIWASPNNNRQKLALETGRLRPGCPSRQRCHLKKVSQHD